MNKEELKPLVIECLNEIEKEREVNRLNKEKEKLTREIKGTKVVSIIFIIISLGLEIRLYILGKNMNILSQFFPIMFCLLSVFAIVNILPVKLRIDEINKKQNWDSLKKYKGWD